jgi:hypothetical protein
LAGHAGRARGRRQREGDCRRSGFRHGGRARGSRCEQRGDGPLSQCTEIALFQSFSGEALLFDEIFVGLLGTESTGAGFGKLRFRVENGDETVIDELFTSANEAAEYFDGGVLEVGSLSLLDPGFPGHPPLPVLDLSVAFDVTSGELGSEFALDFVVAATVVPEPSTLLLVAIGIAVLSVGRGAKARC